MQFLDENTSDNDILMSEAEASKLEKVFVQKLTEKFRLTDRDLKKAFGQFDTDGSGVLDLSELATALKTFLNGVDDMKIRELCHRFDPHGLGKVAYHEFTKHLMAIGEGKSHKPSANAIPTKLLPKPASRPLASRGSSAGGARLHVVPGKDRKSTTTQNLHFLFTQNILNV